MLFSGAFDGLLDGGVLSQYNLMKLQSINKVKAHKFWGAPYNFDINTHKYFMG